MLAAESAMQRKRAGLAFEDRSRYATRYSAAGGRHGPPCAGVRRRALRKAARGCPAPEGEGQWPITELGDYCFSEKPRGLPGPEKICRYERAEDGKLCLTRAFGRDVSGKERYSFDFDAPAAPAQDDELHPHLRELPRRSHPAG